jgi:DNA repair protein RadC
MGKSVSAGDEQLASFRDSTTLERTYRGPPQWTLPGKQPIPQVSHEQADIDTLVEIISQRMRSAEKAYALAFALLDRYNHLAGVLTASEDSLRGELRVPERVIKDLKRHQLVAIKLFRQPIEKGPIFSTSPALHSYLHVRMAHLTVEHIRVLYLDVKCQLIRDELHQTGTPSHVPLQISDIVKKAVLFDAKKLIIVHNHPSGNATPSTGDISLTEQLNITSNLLGIELLDHLIVGASGSTSMRHLGHL